MITRILFASVCAAAIATLAGCASSKAKTAEATEATRIAEQQSQIAKLESELSARDQELKMARAADPGMGTVAARGELFPPNAEPGRCYARVLNPGQYRDLSEQILLKEASERVEIIPAQYRTVNEKVLIKEASTRLEIIPARYETVEERVLVQPETIVIEQVPATYKTLSDEILVSPARTEWKRGAAATFASTGNVVSSRMNDTGEVMCLVEIPAQYRTVTRTVVDQPASTREIVIPAEYKTITKTVLAEPSTTREIEIVEEYGTVPVTKLVTAATERRIEIPAEYGTVSKRSKISDDKLEWREVLCDVNMTRDNVQKIQTSLRDRGFNPGNVDGIFGPETLAGANAFARKEGLSAGSNYITIEVADKLGVKY